MKPYVYEYIDPLDRPIPPEVVRHWLGSHCWAGQRQRDGRMIITALCEDGGLLIPCHIVLAVGSEVN